MQVLDTLTCSYEHYNEWSAARMSFLCYCEDAQLRRSKAAVSDGVKLLFQTE